MDLSPSPRAAELVDRVGRFVREEVEPVQALLHGAGGLTDGPDEVHRGLVARPEIGKHR